MVSTSYSLSGVTFSNRVLVASGTFGYGDECLPPSELKRIGGIVTKSLSLKPRDGNPPPRILETSSGMLNSIGLANIGLSRFLEEKLPFLRNLETVVLANIAGSTIDEYVQVLEALEGHEGIDGYEINVSCPNVQEGGLTFGTSCELTGEITRRLRARTRKPLIIKLTPNVTHISEFARTAESEGADAVSAINTLVGMEIDIQKRKAILPTITGGLSGPAIKPIALAKVYEAAHAVKIPVIGIGGIMNARDAVEFLLAGASMVQVGTANFLDPMASIKIAEGIVEFCEQQKISEVGDLVGSLDVSAQTPVLNSWS